MCIVIDTNVVTAVLNRADEAHANFKPVLDWIVDGKGKIVYGGATYRREVFERMPSYRRLIAEFKKRGKCVVLDHAAVDAAEKRVRAKEPAPDFDDAHLVAMFDVSGCALLCSTDARADKFVQKRELYELNKPPRIYRRSDHRHLLCNESITRCCKPSDLLDGKARAEVRQILP